MSFIERDWDWDWLNEDYIIKNEWNTVLAARCCVQAPLVCTCEGDYHSSSSILTSSGRVAPAPSRQSLHPGPRSLAIIRCRAQLLAPANPQQHWRQFPHSINYPHFISSFPSGALVVRKCMINRIHLKRILPDCLYFTNISLDRSHKALFRIM